MSDDLVKRLRAMGNPPPLDDHEAVVSYVLDAEQDAAAAADRIEQLEAERDQWESQNERLGFQLMDIAAERDTLAEMVRAARIKVRPTASGPWLNCESPDITPDQAERFQQVLDRITKEGP